MNFKPVFAVACAIFAVVGLSSGADAKARITPRITLGFGETFFYSDDCEWIGRNYHCFGPHYIRPYHMAPHNEAYNRMTCDEARWRVRERGFHKIKTEKCVGKNYTFFATKKGHHYRVKVNAFTGRIKALAL